MVELLKSLSTCAELEMIDINDNFLKPQSAVELASLINKCKKLKSLNISDCNL